MMEMVLQDMAAATDLRAIILRYFNPIGSDPDLESGIYDKEPSHVLGQLVMAARGQKDHFTITGTEHPTRDGTGIRDYVHVWDLARAHVAAVEQFDKVLAAEGAPSAIINVGTGAGVTVRELIAAFENVYGKKVPVEEAPPRPGRRRGRLRQRGQGARGARLELVPLPGGRDRRRAQVGREAPVRPRVRVAMAVLDMFRLDGRVAIVTGASSGLGVAFAQALGEAGADVVLGARRTDKLAETRSLVESTGRRALAVATDVSDPESCQALVDAAMAEFGRVDILVNNAGVGTAVPATRETPEQFRQVIDVNLNGCYWMAQACGRVMQPGSSVVNISSVLGLTTAGLPQAAYAASKAGLIGLTRDLAQQWTGRKGIRVNALAPGFFESEMTEQYPPGYLEQQQTRIPVGRKGEGAELAATLVWLVSDAGGYVTGQTVAVDGGMTIT